MISYLSAADLSGLDPMSPTFISILRGGSMVARTARPVLEGEELTTSYLGMAELFSHVAVRRATLAERFGFHCQCDR